MTTNATSEAPLDPRDTVVDVAFVQERYGLGRDASYRLVRSSDFPRSIVPGRVWVGTLAAIHLWEMRVQFPDDGDETGTNGDSERGAPPLPAPLPSAKRGPKPGGARS